MILDTLYDHPSEVVFNELKLLPDYLSCDLLTKYYMFWHRAILKVVILILR